MDKIRKTSDKGCDALKSIAQNAPIETHGANSPAQIGENNTYTEDKSTHYHFSFIFNTKDGGIELPYSTTDSKQVVELDFKDCDVKTVLKLINNEDKNLINRVKQQLTAIEDADISNCKNDEQLYQELNKRADAYVKDNGGEGSDIMAKSLYDSCKGDKGVIVAMRKAFASSANPAKANYAVFLSALTRKEGSSEKSIEYRAAKKINMMLKEKNIGVFWWEDETIRNNGFNVSTNIAMGLISASVFVGLAFDSVSIDQDKNEQYKYSCLLDAYNKEFNYFKYEVETYSNLIDTNGAVQKFVNKVLSKKEAIRFLPSKKDRQLMFFTYGEPTDYKLYPCFNNKNRINEISDITVISDEEKINIIAEKVVNKILNLPIIKALNQSHLPVQDYVPSVQDSENVKDFDYLFKPFDPENKEFGSMDYMDDFPNNLKKVYKESDKDFIKKLIQSTKDNDKSIPKDYYFEYAIVDKATGKNAKNHFLIFPEHYFDDNGNLNWRLKLVVRDWNLAAVFNDDYRKYVLNISSKTKEVNGFIFTQYDSIKLICDDNASINKITCQEYCGTETQYYKNGCAFVIKENVFPTENNDKICAYLSGDIVFSNSTNSSRIFHFWLDFYPYYELLFNKQHVMDKPNKWSYKEDICPFCGRIVTTKKIKTNADLYCYREKDEIENDEVVELCPNNRVGALYEEEDGDLKSGEYDGYQQLNDGVFTSFNDYVQKKSTNPLQAVPKNKMLIIPKDLGKKGAIISMMGVSQSGKSTFISKLFGMRETPIEEQNNNHIINMKYITNAIKPYVKDIQLINIKTTNIAPICSNNSISANGISGLVLKTKYTPKRYSDFIPMTKNEDKNKVAIANMPFLLGLNGLNNGDESGWLSFYDIPGGFIAESNGEYEINKFRSNATMIFNSDCIILFINGTPNKKNDGEAAVDDMTMVTDTLNNVIVANLNKWNNRKPIIAVILGKMDDPKVNLRFESAPISTKTVFKNSDLHRYINKCSEDVKNYIKYNLGGEEFCRTVEQNFANRHCFFAISSIGRSDSMIPADKKMIFSTNFINIENVLLWLMYMTNIIE